MNKRKFIADVKREIKNMNKALEKYENKEISIDELHITISFCNDFIAETCEENDEEI